MPTPLLRAALLFIISISFAACELVGDIFQAGFWVGVVIVVLILAIIGWFFGRTRG